MATKLNDNYLFVLGHQTQGQPRPSIEETHNQSSYSSIPNDIIVNEDQSPGTATFIFLLKPSPGRLYQIAQISPHAANPRTVRFIKQKVPNGTVNMAYHGVDLTAEAGYLSTTISWHVPHAIFAIILVGPDEIPFGIQKDLLCAQSPYFREEFARMPAENTIERIVKLPDTDVDTFGCFQNFIYTGQVYDKNGGRDIPDYTLLMGVWKLATKLKMAPLRVAVLDVMAERRQQTNCIPGTPLLVQAWKETEEGSGLRLMLIGWAAEHMRASPSIRNEFAKSLPQEILSELVIVMSGFPSSPAYTPQSLKHKPYNNPVESDVIEQPRPTNKRPRKSEVGVDNVAGDEPYEVKPTIKKIARRSDAGRRNSRRISTQVPVTIVESADKDLGFCRDLITRMLSGPGFWTRLVGPFTNPVDPQIDNIPNYFDVVKRPMCLRVVKAKLDNGEYASGSEFEADIRLIFQNCYEYWTQDDPIFKKCEEFENYFSEQWAKKHKWPGPQIKAEVID